ncbi:flagellar motor switch protein FliN [Leptospirillum ferriphilum]|jgi:flagellar motor switch protein FliN/FliY|uniref:Flagellar motor switch protein FliN n=4 Tax=Leptospirillum TaxID=179 RepID=A0A059XSB4_9BACT|nr:MULTISPECIES: flagellar motor switch protein FliN [Leptospirillum]EAY57809.1 MAG: flagellar motor switch protein FliN [Leptospirillum rubarum]EDZ39624.1 MAG: flagellar motor switch protein FliN [Leptospirillum sp. Group II '5-way CG']EIJ76029.1 MAG: flagellar motor switch protein FliN [Leptospirillum sp. Group II 'C75']AFS52482.1 flagellar motor switch protein FliN [Leptospirillum ferriphilum ML-04]AIA29950.1 flagellar motor switch protein FliN [Leptospirillum ferriphilum YSK]
MAEEPLDEEALAAAWEADLAKQDKGEEPEPKTEPERTSEPPESIDFLLDVPLTVSVRVGTARMLIKDLLQLGQGSVVELDKLAGEPMEILINDKLVARGEVVMVNDKYGVRLTDIVSPIERIKSL